MARFGRFDRMAMTMQNDENISGQEASLQHLLQKGAELCSEESFDESLAVYAEIEQSLDDDKNNPESRKLIAGVHVRIIECLYAKCSFLLDRGAHDEVFSICEEMGRFLADADPDVRKTSREMRKKIVENIDEGGDFLLQHERADEASALYGKIEQFFSKDEDPEVRSIASRAFIKKYDAEKTAEKLAKKSAELAAEIAAIKEATPVPEENPPETGEKSLIPQPESPVESEETQLLETRLASLDALNLECSLAFKRGDWKKGFAFHDEIEALFAEDENPVIQEALDEVNGNVLRLIDDCDARLLKELNDFLKERSARFPSLVKPGKNEEKEPEINTGCSVLFIVLLILFVILFVIIPIARL
jgi:hypothetical protein